MPIMTASKKRKIISTVAQAFKERGKILSRKEWSDDPTTPHGLTVAVIVKAFRGNWGNLVAAVQVQCPDVWAEIEAKNAPKPATKKATPKPAAKVAKKEK